MATPEFKISQNERGDFTINKFESKVIVKKENPGNAEKVQYESDNNDDKILKNAVLQANQKSDRKANSHMKIPIKAETRIKSFGQLPSVQE